MEYTVRYAVMEDLERVESIYAYARRFMEQTGNPNQWGKQHPPREQLLQDILERKLYVITDQNVIHGVFFFWVGEDPTYLKIYEGSWASATPYGVIHRIAGDGSGGVLAAAVDFASSRMKHLRMDTHADNHVMQKALAKQGFRKRGIIYIEDGSPRLAYDKLID